MRHLGTLIPWFCTEFRYESYGQSGLAWGAIFEKMSKYQEICVFLICMSFFPVTGPQNDFFPKRAPAATLVGPSVFPDSQVISEWLVLQYFQIHGLYQNAWFLNISKSQTSLERLTTQRITFIYISLPHFHILFTCLAQIPIPASSIQKILQDLRYQSAL